MSIKRGYRTQLVALLLCLTALAAVPHSAAAQQAPTEITPKKTSTKPVIYVLDTVSKTTLAKYVRQTIKVKGLIGDYIGDRTRYRFSTDDGSSIPVNGNYPDMGGTHWTLTARVEQEAPASYVLSEISKVSDSPVGGGGGGSLPKIDPLLLAGGGLILAAIITYCIMLARNKAAAERQAYEDRLDAERRRADAARAEAARPAQRAPQGMGGGPGETIAAGAGTEAQPKPPSQTIVSIGSVEVLDGPHARQRFPLQPGETRIGRVKDGAVGIVLDKDGEVSSNHASVIVTMDGRILFKDASRNGSIVDGSVVHHTQVEIPSGSKVVVGGSTLQFALRMPGGTPAPAGAGVPGGNLAPGAAANVADLRSAPTISIEAPTMKAPAPPTAIGFGAELVVAGGPDSGRRFPIAKAETSIGRENTDIVLTDENVSRSHAVLTVKDGAFFLVDNGSTHGTRVGGEKITGEPYKLTNGDVITLGVGTTSMTFVSISG